MANFVIYTNLEFYTEKQRIEWQDTINYIITYQSRIHIVAKNKEEAQENLTKIMEGETTSIHCYAEQTNLLNQIAEIKRVSDLPNEKMIIANDDLIALAVIQANVPNTACITLKNNHQQLCKLSQKYLTKYSSAEEFNELHYKLKVLNIWKRSDWPTTPLYNLQAQIDFINAVLIYADCNEGSTLDECLLAVKDRYNKEMLADVISAPANVSFLRMGFLAKVVRNETEVGVLLRTAEKNAVEKSNKENAQNSSLSSPVSPSI